jgi:CBS domain containing-hemolysin-like protein
MALELFVTFFLVALNGFFVAAEFAIVKVRGSQLELKTSSNRRLGGITKHITHHLDGYLAATQLGITIASLGLGWIGEDVLSKLFMMLFESMGYPHNSPLAHSIAVPIAFTFVTFMHVVFGELTPKSIAIRYPLSTTLALALPLRFFYLIFRPFIFLFNGFANILLRSIGVHSSHGNEVHSEEELRLLLQESSKEGSIDTNKYEIIEKVFKFDDKIVKQIMTPRTRMYGIDIDTPKHDIIDSVMNENYSRVPVYQDNIDNILGILYIRDLLNLLKEDHKPFQIKDFLHTPYYIPTSMRVGDLLLEFQKKSNHMAIITDEFGGTAGLVTMEDIIEELLGEIYDEYDDKTDVSLKVGENEFIVNATVPINVLNQSLPLPLPESPHGDYETLSGLILYITNKIPEINERINFEHYEFTILKRSLSKIQMVQLKVRSATPRQEA